MSNTSDNVPAEGAAVVEPEGIAGAADETTETAAPAGVTSGATENEPAATANDEEPAAAGQEPRAANAGGVTEPAGRAPKADARPGTSGTGGGGAATAGAARTSSRKAREGTVVSNAMEKTAVVVVIERVRHRRYSKTVQRTKRLYVHDEANDVRVGDRVRLSETRPLSKLKRWRVERVLERAR
jgi:small subunit ribosomal protein S17